MYVSAYIAIILNRLFGQVGFKWAVRTVGFVTLACLIVISITMRPRLPPRRRGAILEPHHLRDPVFTLFVVAMSLIMMGEGVYFISKTGNTSFTDYTPFLYSPSWQASTRQYFSWAAMQFRKASIQAWPSICKLKLYGYSHTQAYLDMQPLYTECHQYSGPSGAKLLCGQNRYAG